MASIVIEDWANIRTPRFSYVDESLSFKTSTYVYEQGFNITQADALANLGAQTTNNYNMLYLTSRYDVSDVVELDTLQYSLKTLTTSMRFRDISSNTLTYIQFDPEGYLLTNEDDEISDTTRFQLQFIDERNLFINHVQTTKQFRLNITPSDAVFFSVSGVVADYTLQYLIDPDGYLTIYKNSLPAKILALSGSRLVLQDIPVGDTFRSVNQLIEIDDNYTPLTYKIDQNWVSYQRTDPNLANIDQSRSAFQLPNQFVVSTSYSDLDETVNVNFFNVKSNVSEGNAVKRGSILNNSSNNYPGVDFRFYTSLNTGNEQEKGNENIVLTYVFYDKDIVAQPGYDTAFTIGETMYPYDRLNINDTKFIANGAYGSYAPHISDNVQKLRHNSTGFNNGRYLCTWLSGNAMGDDYMWVDRYYYPNLITKEEAFTTPTFAPSFLDPIDSSAYALTYRSRIINQPLFDKKSDLFFEPNTNYIYKRISNDDLQNHVSSLSSFEVLTQIEPVKFEGYTSFPIEVDKINESGQFTISFDLYLSPKAVYGHSILGNLTNYGLAVLNDTFITPILVSLSATDVYFYNTDPLQISYQRFAKNVKDIIRFESLDNYITVCDDGYVYECKADNTINRLTIIPALSSYLSYASYEDYVTFLLDTSGNCITFNKYTAAVANVIATNPLGVALNSIAYTGTTLYGLGGTNLKKYDAENVCYLFENTIFKYNIAEAEAVPVVKSNSNIVDYAIDDFGNYLFIHNVEKFTLLNKNRSLMFTQTLSAIPLSGTKCEFIRQYEFGQATTQLAIAGVDLTGISQIALYDYDGVMRAMGPIAGDLLNTQTNFTNYNYHVGTINDQTLDFKIRLENQLNNADTLSKTLTYDYSQISEGFTNLTYVFDSIRGTITLSVNGVIYATETFDPAKYTVTRIFGDRIIAGATGFYNGITLSEYTQQPNYHFVTGTTIRNLYVYNKSLKAGDINTINLVNSDIQPITLSVPCGQRSNIEEIIRYFKFGVPGSQSNHITIEVKNSGISDSSLQSSIENNIRLNIAKYIKSDVIIDDITFVDYSSE